MMRFVVTSRGDNKSNSIKRIIDQYLTDLELISDNDSPDLVITVGGDGTFLHAVHQYFDRLEDTAFIGVHTGHLGFYADWLPDEIEKLVIEIAKERFDIVKYPLLEMKVFKENEVEPETYLALNETTIKKSEGSLVLDVDINGELFERFRGDGLCMSTPSGSTAYNKALGGAIIHPSLKTMQLTEMSSINNRVYRTIGAPLIFPSHHVVQFKPTKPAQNFLMSIDHIIKPIDNVRLFECAVSDKMIRFARFRPFPFWKRVHDSFISDER